MDCPEHKVKAKYLSCNSTELCYECPEKHIFFVKIEEIEDDTERAIVKLLATDPIARKLVEFLLEPKGTEEVRNFIKAIGTPKYIL